MLQALKRQPFRFVLWETKLTGGEGIFLVYNQPPSFLLIPVGKWQVQVDAGISEDQESYQEGLNGKIIGSGLSFFILLPASGKRQDLLGSTWLESVCMMPFCKN